MFKRVGLIAGVAAVVVLALLGSFMAGYVVRDARSDETEVRVYRDDPETLHEQFGIAEP